MRSFSPIFDFISCTHTLFNENKCSFNVDCFAHVVSTSFHYPLDSAFYVYAERNPERITSKYGLVINIVFVAITFAIHNSKFEGVKSCTIWVQKTFQLKIRSTG